MNLLSQDDCVFIGMSLLFTFFDISSDSLHMGTKGGRSLYFPISKCFHAPSLSPCLACGTEVSGFVCLKQLLAHQMFGSIILNSHYLKFV
jgi:hypothetical protein